MLRDRQILPLITCNMQTLQEIEVWCQTELIAAYGPVEGLKRYQRLPVLEALRMWADHGSQQMVH